MTKQEKKKYLGVGAIIGTSAIVTGVHMIRKKVKVHRERKYIKQFIAHYMGHNQYLIDTVDQLSCDQVKEMSQLIRDVMDRKEKMEAMGSRIDQNIHHIIDKIEACVKEDKQEQNVQSK